MKNARHKKSTLFGRGAGNNPAGRFEAINYEPDLCDEAEKIAPRTRFFQDATRSIIAWNKSPDIPFDAGVNPYRGCEHGCIYCYARPSHEYLGLSAGLDFETKIFVKKAAPALLRKALMSPNWKPQPIALSGITDPYQPAEKRFRLTRQCLEVLADFRNPVGVITKNHLITRDIDVLQKLADVDAVKVAISVTTLNARLASRMEPRTSSPGRRLAAIRKLSDAGIPVGVMTAPIIPGLNDHEIPRIIEKATEAGAQFAGYVMLRLPHGVKSLFANWLERYYPDRKEKVLNRIRDTREGALNNSNFHERMRGNGLFAAHVRDIFHLSVRKAGIDKKTAGLSTAAFRRPGAEQLCLF